MGAEERATASTCFGQRRGHGVDECVVIPPLRPCHQWKQLVPCRSKGWPEKRKTQNSNTKQKAPKKMICGQRSQPGQGVKRSCRYRCERGRKRIVLCETDRFKRCFAPWPIGCPFPLPPPRDAESAARTSSTSWAVKELERELRRPWPWPERLPLSPPPSWA